MEAEPHLNLSRELWAELTRELHRRTEDRHESGAFLLGRIDGSERRATQAAYYDDLEPKAYEHGICTLGSRAFARLWDLCAESGLAVVADVHVHFANARQSRVDMRNPMIAQPGHLALILPDMARPPIRLNSLGIYEYLGSHQWRSRSCPNRSRALVLEDAS